MSEINRIRDFQFGKKLNSKVVDILHEKLKTDVDFYEKKLTNYSDVQNYYCISLNSNDIQNYSGSYKIKKVKDCYTVDNNCFHVNFCNHSLWMFLMPTYRNGIKTYQFLSKKSHKNVSEDPQVEYIFIPDCISISDLKKIVKSFKRAHIETTEALSNIIYVKRTYYITLCLFILGSLPSTFKNLYQLYLFILQFFP